MEELAGLFVSIGADFSALDEALAMTQLQLEILAAEGGLLGGLADQAPQDAALMVAGIAAALTPLPEILAAGLQTPVETALNALSAYISAQVQQLLADIHHAAGQIMAAVDGLNQIAGGALGLSAAGGVSPNALPLNPMSDSPAGGGVAINGSIAVYGVQDVQSLVDEIINVSERRSGKSLMLRGA